MKKLALFFAILFPVLAGAAVREETYADTSQKITITSKKLTLERFGLYLGESKTKRNHVPYGAKVKLRLVGLAGMVTKDNKVNLKVTIKVTTPDGQIALENDDLFKTYRDEGGLPADAVKDGLTLSITCQTPIKINQKCTAVFSIKDEWGDGEMNGTFILQTVPIEGCTYRENGITSDGPVFKLQPQDQILTDNFIYENGKLYCLVTRVNGLTTVKGMVFPNLAIIVKDENGKIVEEYQNLLKTYL
ncbi:MAG TPA: hypothetical protein VNX68_09555, partial [Nitrosopumilaceae archaeon]|nr:hypothetical protein [Nitrosopumilaceae archaeon]